MAESHHQTRRGLALAVAFVAAAPVAAVVPHHTGAWLPLHLFLVGGLVGAISAATQMLAVTWSSSPPPKRWLAAVQRWTLAAGALALAVGRERHVAGLSALGGTAVLVSLVALAVILLGVRRAAVTPRYLPAIDAYLAAIAAGLVGGAIGTAMTSGHVDATRLLALREAHLSVNVFGLVGLVVAGTLPFFTATQIRSKMAPWATAGRIRAAIAWLGAAVAVTAVGHLAEHPGWAAAGLAAYAVGIGAVVALCPRVSRRQLDWAGPRLVQLAAGLAWWVAMTVVLAAQFASGRGDDGPVLRALAVGGFAQILVASLAYLGPVLRGGGPHLLTAGFATTRSWVSLAVGNVAAALALADRSTVLVVALGVWLVELAIRAVRLVTAQPGPGRGPAPAPADGGDEAAR